VAEEDLPKPIDREANLRSSKDRNISDVQDVKDRRSGEHHRNSKARAAMLRVGNHATTNGEKALACCGSTAKKSET